MKIKSKIDTNSESYKENYQYHRGLLDQLNTNLAEAHLGGGEKTLSYLREKGKLPVRERITELIDAGTKFLEFSPLAGDRLYKESVPAGGIVTGVGIIKGRSCMIIANDPSVKGGTYFPITVKKHLRAQEIAEENHLPCIHLVDSGGAFLPSG